MLKSISISGWKNGNGEYEFGTTNLIVGPNGSGKSTIIDAIRLATTGEVLGLGKANQSLAKAANGNLVRVALETDQGALSVELKRNKSSVSKNVEGEQWKLTVPMSVPEIQALSGAEMRSLMSFGDDQYERSQFKQDILAEAGGKAKDCMALFNDQGNGSLEDVDVWAREIATIANAEASNLRESRSALENTRSLLEKHKPVPKKILQEWNEEKSKLQEKLRSIEKKMEVTKPAVLSVHRLKEKIQDAIEDMRMSKENLHRVNDQIREARRLQFEAEKADESAIESARSDIKNLREKIANSADYVARRANFCKWLDSVANKIREGLDKFQFKPSDSADMREAAETIEKFSQRMFSDSDEDENEDLHYLERLKGRLESMEAPTKALKEHLANCGYTSLDAMEQSAEIHELRLAGFIKARSDAEKELAALEEEMGMGADEIRNSEDVLRGLESQALGLKQQLGEVNKKLSDHASTEQLKISEADLAEQVEDLEKRSNGSKLAAKTAAIVQARYLEGPIERLQPHLNKFCETVGIGTTECKFVQQGRSLNMEIAVKRGRKTIPLETLSGGEKLIVGCAFLYALNKVKQESVGCSTNLIIVEAAELDNDNAKRLLAGLEMAGKEGIQSFMTSFTMIEGEHTVIETLREEVLC